MYLQTNKLDFFVGHTINHPLMMIILQPNPHKSAIAEEAGLAFN